MKILSLSILMLAVITMTTMFLIMPMAIAQDDANDAISVNAVELEDENLSGNPGITPDSALHGIDRALERIRYAMTIGSDKKAAYGLKIAEERLLEAKKMAEKGNVNAMEKAQKLYDKELEKVKSRIEQLREDGEAPKIKLALKSLIVLQRKIEAHEHRIEVLKDILSENENLTDEQRTVLEEIIARMENRTEFLKQIQEQRKDKIKTRYRAITEKNATEVDGEIADMENATGLTQSRKLRAEKSIEKTESAIAKLKERLDEEKLKGVNVTALEDYIASVEQLVEDAKLKVQEEDYEGAIAILKEVNNYGRNMKVIVHKMKLAREQNKTERIETLKDKAKEKLPDTAKMKIRQELKEEIKKRKGI